MALASQSARLYDDWQHLVVFAMHVSLAGLGDRDDASPSLDLLARLTTGLSGRKHTQYI